VAAGDTTGAAQLLAVMTRHRIGIVGVEVINAEAIATVLAA
jgi:hypothetical protein